MCPCALDFSDSKAKGKKNPAESNVFHPSLIDVLYLKQLSAPTSSISLVMASKTGVHRTHPTLAGHPM